MAVKRSTRKKVEEPRVEEEIDELRVIDIPVSEIKSPRVKENHLTIFEMGVLFYLENFGLREMPKEKKANLMGNRIEAAERKLKALGYIKG